MPKKMSLSKFRFIYLLQIMVGFTIPSALHLLTRIGIKETFYSLILFVIAGILLYISASEKKHELLLRKILLGFTLFIIVHFFYNLIVTYKTIPQWDFLCFYLFGKVGISSSDFYNPHVFREVFNNLHLQNITGGSFIDEVVNVGFWYPPPSMFLFLPLALFEPKTSYIIWQTVIIIFLVADIFLLVKFYSFRKDGNYSNINILLFLIILILLFPNINAVVSYSQTLSLFLFFLILVIQYINSWKCGVFLAILIIIKPLAAVFLLYFIFFKKWKEVSAFAITGIFILLITGSIFGFGTFLNYFKFPPTDRIPDFIYFEYSSLFAVLKKLQRIFPDYLTLKSLKIIYYLCSLILIIITFFASRKLSQSSTLKSFFVFIPLALIIYPATLFHYIIILLPVLLNIFYYKQPENYALNLVLIFLLYCIGYYSIFFFSMAVWIMLMTWPLPLRYFKNNKFVVESFKYNIKI